LNDELIHNKNDQDFNPPDNFSNREVESH